jgi:hypothetical protein
VTFLLKSVLILLHFHFSLYSSHTVTLTYFVKDSVNVFQVLTFEASLKLDPALKNFEKCVPEFHTRICFFGSSCNLFVLFYQQEIIWLCLVAILIATTRKRSAMTISCTYTTWVATHGLAMKFLATLMKVLYIFKHIPPQPFYSWLLCSGTKSHKIEE